MKIAKKTPVAHKVPVYVTADKYALYVLKPAMLGYIVKRDGLWETADGVKFMSSRAAIDYLSKIRNSVEVEVQLESRYIERLGYTREDLATPDIKPILAPGPKSNPSPTVMNKSILTDKPHDPTKPLEPRTLEELLRSLGYVRDTSKNMSQ